MEGRAKAATLCCHAIAIGDLEAETPRGLIRFANGVADVRERAAASGDIPAFAE